MVTGLFFMSHYENLGGFVALEVCFVWFLFVLNKSEVFYKIKIQIAGRVCVRLSQQHGTVWSEAMDKVLSYIFWLRAGHLTCLRQPIMYVYGNNWRIIKANDHNVVSRKILRYLFFNLILLATSCHQLIIRGYKIRNTSCEW